MQRETLLKYAAVALLFAAPLLYLARHVVPAFEWLSIACVLVGCFSMMAARQGPSKAAAKLGKQLLAFTGIWVLICVGLIVYWMR